MKIINHHQYLKLNLKLKMKKEGMIEQKKDTFKEEVIELNENNKN